MKRFKYMITSQCPYSCAYCINKYTKFTPTVTYKDPLSAIKHMWEDRFTSVVLTGGEPTTNMSRVNAVAFIAKSHGMHVGLQTANIDAMKDRHRFDDCVVDDIVLGIHDTRVIPQVRINKPVYAQVVYKSNMNYTGLCEELYHKNYAGLTLVEEWPRPRELSKFMQVLPLILTYANFSLHTTKCDTKPFDLVCHEKGGVQIGVGQLHDLPWRSQ